MSKKILIVDDDPHIRDVLIFALEKGGMKVVCASNGKEALTRFQQEQPALVVLDISMPEMDGLETCREIRKTSDIPILFLSSRDEEIDRIIGLEIGGDDYVTKPFSARELVARVNVILKRYHAPATKIVDSPSLLSHGALELDTEKHIASWKKQPLQLTSTEFSLLKTLLSSPEKVYERDQLMTLAYGGNIHVSDRTIDSHIRHLRDKLQQAGGIEAIQTVRGVGYKLGPCA